MLACKQIAVSLLQAWITCKLQANCNLHTSSMDNT
uniref:Uncharacterized protein n=1 Tax=Arundo donax TaxID=35708 RepID=A0A0A8ZES1_ARUDO